MKNYQVHGVYCLSNVAGLEVHIEEGYDPIVYYRLVIIDGMKPQKWYKSKVYSTNKGNYFRFGNSRIYLNQIMRV